jgi:Holliday junction resolvase RusA-like endonuclease
MTDLGFWLPHAAYERASSCPGTFLVEDDDGKRPAVAVCDGCAMPLGLLGAGAASGAAADVLMPGTLLFTVEGRPQTAGSKVAVPITKAGARIGTRVVESGDRAAKRSWREDVRAAAREAIGQQAGWPLDGPCAVELLFTRRRPQSHYGKRRGASYVKDSAPSLPTTRPDLLKVARAVEDALSGITWHDDAVIVDEHLRKRWGEREGVTVTIRPLSPVA